MTKGKFLLICSNSDLAKELIANPTMIETLPNIEVSIDGMLYFHFTGG